MELIDQTIVGLNNPRANCCQAAIATVTGKPLEQVLDITTPAIINAWTKHLELWAKCNGFQLIIAPDALPKGPSIAVGKTTRSNDYHAVVYVDGKFLHDPHPSKAGITEECYFLNFQRTWAKKPTWLLEVG